MAVLAVIRNEAAATGRCTLPVARIAERANVGRAKVRAAIKLAERLEIIAIEIAPDRKRVIINRVPTCRKKAGNSLPRSPDRVLRHVRCGSFASFPRCPNYVRLCSKTGDKAGIARGPHLCHKRSSPLTPVCFGSYAAASTDRFADLERSLSLARGRIHAAHSFTGGQRGCHWLGSTT
jgi:hypothetical protein